MEQTQKTSEEQKKKKLQEIANKIGTSIDNLVETSTPDAVIENYSNENLKVLNE